MKKHLLEWGIIGLMGVAFFGLNEVRKRAAAAPESLDLPLGISVWADACVIENEHPVTAMENIRVEATWNGLVYRADAATALALSNVVVRYDGMKGPKGKVPSDMGAPEHIRISLDMRLGGHFTAEWDAEMLRDERSVQQRSRLFDTTRPLR